MEPTRKNEGEGVNRSGLSECDVVRNEERKDLLMKGRGMRVVMDV